MGTREVDELCVADVSSEACLGDQVVVSLTERLAFPRQRTARGFAFVPWLQNGHHSTASGTGQWQSKVLFGGPTNDSHHVDSLADAAVHIPYKKSSMCVG